MLRLRSSVEHCLNAPTQNTNVMLLKVMAAMHAGMHQLHNGNYVTDAC